LPARLRYPVVVPVSPESTPERRTGRTADLPEPNRPDGAAGPDRTLAARMRGFARAAGVCVAMVGLTTFAGWVLGREDLKAVFVPNGVTMKTNAALALLCGGVSLWLLSGPFRSLRRVAAARVLAVLVMAAGTATLFEHLTGRDLGIDQSLFREAPGARATTSPNRMGPPASTSFMLLGLSLLLLDTRRDRAAALRQGAAIAVVVIALLPLIGYATGVSPLFAVARVTGIALVTAIVLLVLAAGILAARPEHGLAALLCLPGEAGTLARRLIVPAFLLPFVAAIALTRGVRAGWLDDRFATAAMALIVIVSLTGVIWKTAADLSRALRARDAAEAERARREEALRAANRRQTEFLAVLSHELRNPLAPMRYALEMMPDTPGRSHKAVVDRQLTHLVRLVDDLLDVSRMSTGKFQLRRRRIDLGHAMAEAVEAARPDLQRARHNVVVLPPAETVYLDADPDRLTQVLTNLLNNAARYTPPAGQVTVSAQAVADEVLVRVRDTGVGLQPDDLDRVFEMFSQVGGAGTGGLGIGLSLVKTIVEMHGGRVEAHSDGPGQGSEFRFWLPRAGAPMPAVPDGPSPSSGRRRTIVVADDNDDAADMLRAVLELDGHVVRVASNGHAAFDLIATFAPEVAVLDIGMPGMDGYEVARRVRNEGRPVYLIAVTGWGQEADRRRADAAGFDAHLTKPASPDELRRLVARR
jgi:signal transduction histidine kinase/CheY-like chemotaxis protein